MLDALDNLGRSFMNKLFIRMLNEKSIVVSIVSIVFSILGLYGLLNLVSRMPKMEYIEFTVFIIVSLIIEVLLILKSVYMEISSIKTLEKRILCGIGIGNSEYSIVRLLKKKHEEIIIVAQNMGTLAMIDKFVENIIEAINENNTKVKIFLVPYSILKCIDKKYGDDLKFTIEKLIYILRNIKKDKKCNLIIRFNLYRFNSSQLAASGRIKE